MRAAVFGHARYGGVQLRGVQVAQQLGWPFYDLAEGLPLEKWDVGLIVKYAAPVERTLRQRCRFLMADPLDCWNQQDICPYQFWRQYAASLRPDLLLSTSLACQAVMTAALEGQGIDITIAHLPHAADPRIQPGCFRQAGPLVYWGDDRYLPDGVRQILAAVCDELGRYLRLVPASTPWEVALADAALLLHPRLGKSATRINRWCKPQIKLENAAAAELPLLATDCPAVMTLREVELLAPELWYQPERLAKAIERAIGRGPLRQPQQLADYCTALQSLIP